MARAFAEVGRAAQRGDHVRELLQRAAAVQGVVHLVQRLGLVRGQATHHQQLGGQRARDLQQSRLTPLPVLKNQPPP